MAKQLYDYWFVQFDFPNGEGKPYKSSGGAMVWNEKLKREIPNGWTVKTVGTYANCKSGYAIKSSDFKAKGIPVIKIGNIQEDYTLNMNGCQYIENNANKQFYAYQNDVVIAMTGATIGKFAIVPYSETGYFVNQRVGKFELGNNPIERMPYLINSLKIDYFRNQIFQLASGCAQPNISAEQINNISLLYPSTKILSEYNMKCKWMYEQMVNCRYQIDILTKLRDKLLPLLMNGQASVNYHLSASFLSSLILYRDQYKFYDMKETIIQTVLDGMRAVLTENQLDLLTDVTRKALSECEITPKATEEEQRNKENVELLGAFISSKKVEGCSDKTIHYYKSSIEKLIATVKKNVCDIATNDIRCYLAEQQEQRGLSKVTIDNLRRIYSSFFSWLEDEDYITKSPVRRIHKVRTDALVKEVLTDENIEVLRDSCQELRDIAMIDLLLSTGMRVGELVKINRDDIDFQERQCVVFGKGNKEREVYFNARTKIHLKKYLEQRTDTNPALFVSLHEPHTRLTISGVEVRLRQLGKRVNLNKVHPHKFRRTLATMAIDKGMPIEQVQKMLGHVKIDTTLHYAMVNQTNVKIAHRKFLN